MSKDPTEPNTLPPAPPAKRKKPPSRSQRWADAVGEAQAALAEIASNVDALENAVEELKEVQQEYSDWKDNLPENLASSSLGEKLEEVTGIDLEGIADAVRNAVDEAESALGEAESIDLPRGFGRD